MIEQSESIADLAKAMAKAQASVEGAKKDSTNPHFKSNYADLASVWEACREPLTANGLSVIQFPGEMVENRMTMTTQLNHESGQWMRATLSIPLSKVDAQGYGSAVTYARRYALAAVVGVCPEDDDENAASKLGNQAAAKIDANQCAELRRLIEKADATEAMFCNYINVGTLPELPAKDFERAKNLLMQRVEGRAGK